MGKLIFPDEVHKFTNIFLIDYVLYLFGCVLSAVIFIWTLASFITIITIPAYSIGIMIGEATYWYLLGNVILGIPQFIMLYESIITKYRKYRDNN